MKSTTMLAQITTQQDVLFAGITMKQLLLWVVGGVLIFGIFLAVPQPLKLSLSKGIVMVFIGIFISIVSLKREDKLLLDHISLRIAYLWRSRLHLDQP